MTHTWHNPDADVRVCLVCGLSLGPYRPAFAERARISGLLTQWSSRGEWMPGVERTHAGLLAYLAAVWAAPDDENEPCHV